MSLTFAHYWPLVFTALIPFAWWVRRRSRVRLSVSSLKRLTFVRSLVLLLLISSLMQPVWRRAGSWVSLVFAVDVSRSVSPEFIETALQWMDEASSYESRSRHRYVAFARTARLVGAVDAIRALPVAAQRDPAGGTLAAGTLDQSETDIEEAVTQALRSFAPHSLRRLVLISDGRETTGDLTRSLEKARELGVRVFTLPAQMRGEGSISIENVGLPRDVRAGEPFEVNVRVWSPEASTTTLAVDRLDEAGGREALARRPLELDPGMSSVVVPVRLTRGGLAAIEVGLTTDEDSRVRETLWVGRKHRVLYLEGRPESARYLQKALEEEGLEIRRVGASQIPESERLLDENDAVIVSDIPSNQMGERKMTALKDYVERGGGLVFVGGETSFGASGYSETPIEEALPVIFRVQEKHKEVALEIVLDKSYSMKGEKIELAKEATKAALDLLDETHYFGVVTFDWYPHVAVPLQLAENKEGIKQMIGEIGASSPTRIYPALEKAYEQLKENEAKVKHIILLSDGKSHRDEFERLVTRMTEDDITISTVGIGEEVDEELLKQIAQWGKGRSYFIEDARRVAEIFLKEAQIAMESTLVEEPFHPVLVERVEALEGIDFAAAPALRGHVNTQAKPSAEVILESESGAPLLCRWQYGLGKSVFFASDAKDRWGSAWLEWEGYGKFWSQLIRETLRRQEGGEIDFDVERRGDRASVTLGVIDENGRFKNGMTPVVDVMGGDGRRERESLRQVGPGRYQADVSLQASGNGAYTFRLDGSDLPEDTMRDVGDRGVYFGSPEELRWRTPDIETLRRISEQTGGKFEPSVEDLFEDYGETTSRPVALWPYLAGLAIFFYLVDLTLRRAAWLWERAGR